MSAKKNSDFYLDEELKQIRELWLKDKARINDDPVFGYYFDRDQEYERHLNNANLRALFRHAARLRHQLIDGEMLYLYPGEAQEISKVYGRIVQNGYFSRSKQEEKRVRA